MPILAGSAEKRNFQVEIAFFATDLLFAWFSLDSFCAGRGRAMTFMIVLCALAVERMPVSLLGRSDYSNGRCKSPLSDVRTGTRAAIN